jgi:hypothetical protein
MLTDVPGWLTKQIGFLRKSSTEKHALTQDIVLDEESAARLLE